MKYIDLGLPSGTLWADCNVGAINCWDYGNYLNFENAQQCGILPTREQMLELVQCTTKKVCRIHGILGTQFTGQNGNTIFMPFAGFLYPNNIRPYAFGGHGYWWSCTFSGINTYNLYLDNDERVYPSNYNSPIYGFSVRLVKNILWK